MQVPPVQVPPVQVPPVQRKSPRRAVDLRFRYLYKPITFCAALVPFAGCVGGVLALYGLPFVRGFNLGVDPQRYVLDIFGKTSLNLLLITLAVSPARQLTHWGNLLRLRRMLGLFAFFYALMHFTMYIFYENVSWQMIVQDIAKRPYTTVGFAALVLLVPLAITSTNGMMRRLGRRWQTLHRLVYLIPCLGVLHYWKQIKLAGREPLVYVSILAVLLLWRAWKRWIPAALAARAPVTSRSAAPRAQGKA